jgi:uncharacterized protein
MQKRFMLNWKLISAVAAVMLVVVAMLSIAAGSAGAQDTTTPSRVITVSGSGEAFGAPDVAYVNLGIDVSDPDIGKALDTANQTMTGIVAAITDAGVDAKDIQTVDFNVYPEDKVDPQTGQPTGVRVYHVQNSVNVTVRDISKVGAVMQAGLGAGANTVNSLTFGISDMKSLQEQARLQAVDDARSRAQQLADAFGVKLGDVISVSESFGSVPVPLAFKTADAFAVTAASAPQVNPGQLSVDVQLNVSFAIGG